MPRIVDGFPAPEAAGMLADDGAVLADDDAVGIGLDLNRPADSARGDRVFVLVEGQERTFIVSDKRSLKAGLGDRRRDGVEAVKAAGNGD
jgi:hypothetical protein